MSEEERLAGVLRYDASRVLLWKRVLPVLEAAEEVTRQAVEDIDSRLDYVNVQMDRQAWDALRAALAALDTEEGGE